jgi:DNA polymerase elongation subunit (family B)
MKQIIRELLNDTIIYDIECSSEKDGLPINIKEDFDEYVKNAKVKWVGVYSYRTQQYYLLNAITQRDYIKELFSEYKYYVGFNNNGFDTLIMINNGLIDKKRNLDLMLILGSSKYETGFKERAKYMGVTLQECYINNKKFGANSLQGMAKAFGIETLKGDIDYKIFFNNLWDENETEEIKKYLKADVEITKKLFDITIDFWELFTDWLNDEDIKNWVWIDSTIASLTYISACKVKNTKPTFSNNSKGREKMGGRAIQPSQEESYNIHYLDETSKYPHIISEFNLSSEIDITKIPKERLDKYIEQGLIFHGNEKFKVKGYYDTRKHGILETDLINRLKTRFAIKKYLKNNEINDIIKPLLNTNLKGLEYAIKIYANSYYGALRSSVFEKIYTPNAGYDCCWIGQQIHKYVEDYFISKGLKVIGGFTDSWFVEGEVSKELIVQYGKEIMEELKKYMPFPEDTHTIEHECFMNYILYNYDDKSKEYKKNNYAFISNNKIKIVGFPIKKSNASKLSLHIFNKYLREEGIKNKRLKWKKSYILNLVQKELKDDITLSAVRFNCNSYNSYKNTSQIQAQISKNYLNNKSGNIDLIKNKRIGSVGKDEKYCTIEEANNLRFDDLVLDTFWNEIEPFIEKQKVVNLSGWGL